MALGLAVPVIAIIAILAASSSSSSGGAAVPPPADKIPPPSLDTCTKAILGLPNVKGAGGTPSLQEIVTAAMISTAMSAADYQTMAEQLDTLAAATTDPELKVAAQGAAACLRARALTVGKEGTPPPADLKCEDAIKLLPADLQSQIIAARTAGSEAMLKSVADAIDALALLQTDNATRLRMQLTAKCLRAVDGGKVEVGGGTGKAGIASAPGSQWYAEMTPSPPWLSNSVDAVTRSCFSLAGYTVMRAEELLNLNKPTDANGRDMHLARTSTILPVGTVLKIPKTWNRFVDQRGNMRHGPTPFPVA